MNARRLERFERLLLDERRRITDTLSRIAVSAAAPSSNDIVPGDDMGAGAAGVVPADDDAIVARETAALQEVDEALRLLRDSPHDYGICVRCGRPIPDERLAILPATRICGRSS